MVISNFTERACLSNFGIPYQLLTISVFNIFLSISAVLGNILILVALRKESTLHPPSKLLFRSLASSDLCVGLISQPLYAAYLMTHLNESWAICRYAFEAVFITGYLLCSVSLFTLTAISVDRLLALLLRLRYRQAITLKRAYVIVVSFWVVSTVATAMYFWNYLITLWCGCVIISLCLTTSILSYTKIFVTLRHHKTQVQGNVHQQQASQTTPVCIERYKKAVASALWLQLTMVFCYLPHGIVTALWGYNEMSSYVFFARQCTATLVYLNSALNPILYCWKIVEVRQAVKNTIRQFCCSSS
ncbi:adenosine receptor A2b-like [Oculina patagonica]